MKNVWKTVNIPKNIRNISEPQRLSDSIMEQYGLIRKLTNLNIPKFINNQICFRLVRGKNEKEFEYLSYPISKKLVWVSSSSKINRLFSDKKDKLHAISDYTGKSLDWIHKKYEEGYKWRLIIIPKQHCILADWNGLFKLITKFYPSIAARVLRSKENLMKHKFNEIEQQIVPTNTFRFLKDNPLHENHIDLNKYQDIVIPELWQTRALLYNLIGLNENYAGDGFVYNDSNEKMHKEYFTINGEILEIFGVKVIPIET